jgi:hypothetical protein
MAAALAGPIHAASTKFQSTWKSPDAASVDLRGQKVAALVIRKDDVSRQEVEYTLAKELIARGMQGVAAYTIVPASELRNREAAKARMDKAGIVAVVVMKEIGQATQFTESAATYYATASYNTFWGYYDSGWAAVYEPSYLSMDRVITVETLVYDLRKDKLVWAGMSESTNPKMATQLIKDLVATAANEMKKQGLVKPRP